MILPPALLLGAHLVMPVADSVPTLNVDQVCQGIAQQGGVSFHDNDVSEEKQNCLDSEQAIRDELVKEWSNFSSVDKTACTNEARMGGDSSYTELITCLEMARDVRNLQNDADTSRAPAATPAAKPAAPAAAATPPLPAAAPTPAQPNQQ
jgi:cytoskeletal protein RodZ